MKRLIAFLLVFASVSFGQQVYFQASTAGGDTAKPVPSSKFGIGAKFFTFPNGSKFTTAAGFYPFPNIADTSKYMKYADTSSTGKIATKEDVRVSNDTSSIGKMTTKEQVRTGYAALTAFINDSLYRHAQDSILRNLAFASSPADKPPDVAGTYDDEFNSKLDTTSGTPSGATQWKKIGWEPPKSWGADTTNFSDAVVATKAFTTNGGLYFSKLTSTTGGDSMSVLAKALAPTDTVFSISAKVSRLSTLNGVTAVGLVMYNETNGRLVTIELYTVNNIAHYGYAVCVWNSVTSFSAARLTQGADGTPGNAFYLRLTKKYDDVTTKPTPANIMWQAWISPDGIIWSAIHVENNADFIEATGKISHIGVFVENNNNATVRALFSWFRYNWVADWKPN